MRIAVIGAGAAGLAALRHCSVEKDRVEVVCYEKTEDIGGTWVYVPETGNDKYGLPIHTSMYESLRTNLPKEVMGYPDYQIPEGPRSYLFRTDIVEFLKNYCDHFKLRDKIRFLHNVELVEPTTTHMENRKKWRLRVRDLERDVVVEEYFDAVMVCNGHYFEPFVPNIKGQEIFKGLVMHSHDYRVADVFANKRVLIVGVGPSAMDLALEISSKAKIVLMSHHYQETIWTEFPKNVEHRHDLIELKAHSAVFENDFEDEVDTVFYCTGYKYSFPFLADSCGVKVDTNMVTPLWKHVISIENPTLALIGLPFYVCAFSMFDLQVRFVLKFWLQRCILPSREEMLEDEYNEKIVRFNDRNMRKRHFHMMAKYQGQYYDDLADTAGLTRLPPVLTLLHNESSSRFMDDLVNYRKDCYTIVDDENYIYLNDRVEDYI